MHSDFEARGLGLPYLLLAIAVGCLKPGARTKFWTGYELQVDSGGRLGRQR